MENLTHIHVALHKNKIILTDTYNLFNKHPINSPFNLIIRDDDVISLKTFKKYYTDVNNFINTKDKITVYVNPKVLTEGQPIILTMPRELNNLQNVEVYMTYTPLKTLVIETEVGKATREISVEVFEEAKDKLATETWGPNAQMKDEQQFRLLIQMLAFFPVTITENFYNRIYASVNTYQQFYPLPIQQNRIGELEILKKHYDSGETYSCAGYPLTLNI